MLIIKLQNRGFTIIELIIVITIFVIIFAGTSVVIANLYGKQNLKNHGLRLVDDLREAYTNSVSQKNNSTWGVKLDTTTNPDRYVIFKGTAYTLRDASFDRVVVFPAGVFLNQISLNGGGTELLFGQGSGRTSDYGSFRLATSETSDGTFLINVNGLGLVDYDY